MNIQHLKKPKRLTIASQYENKIAKMMQNRGFSTILFSEFKDVDKKPLIKQLKNSFCLPDILVFAQKMNFWMEVKRKNSRFFMQKEREYAIGIDADNYIDYKKIVKITKLPLYFAFILQDTNEILFCSLEYYEHNCIQTNTFYFLLYKDLKSWNDNWLKKHK